MKSKNLIFFTILLAILVGCSDECKQYDDGVFFGQISYSDLKSAAKKRIKRYSDQIEEVRQVIEILGLTKDVKLMQLGKEKQISGEFQGGFLSGTSGSFKSFSTVIFRWKSSNGQSFFAELPFDKVCFENIQGGPFINFVFCVDPFYGHRHKEPSLFIKKPTMLVNSDNVFLATIKISEEDINKYLGFK